MSFDPILVRARWCINVFPGEQFPAFAQEALARGANGPALRRLAGLVKPARRDIADVVEQAFSELGVPALSRQEAITTVARDYATRILERQLDPYYGALELSWLCVEAGYPEVFVPFMGLVDEYEIFPDQREKTIKDIVDEAMKLVSG